MALPNSLLILKIIKKVDRLIQTDIVFKSSSKHVSFCFEFMYKRERERTSHDNIFF